MLIFKHLEGLLAVISGLMLIAFAGQVKTQGLVHHRVVIANQNKRIH